MIAVTQKGDEYEIKFPYDVNIIFHIKNVPGRQWHPELKVWTIPKDKLGFLLNEFKGTHYEYQLAVISQENININQTLDVTTTIPDIDVSQIPYYVKDGSKPFKHQIDFMKFALHRQLSGNMHGFLVADEQGTAKTNEAMNLALYNRKQYGYKHCLVVCCINTSKYNWVADISEHTKYAEVPYILGTRLKRNGEMKSEMTSENKLKDLQIGHMYGDANAPELPYFLITNVEVFRGDAGAVFTKQLIGSINSGFISMIVIDEIHKNLSHTSTQGKRVLKVKRDTGSGAMWLPMTGTPIVNKPLDLFLPLKLIDAHTYKSYYTWANDFAIFDGYGHDVISYKNMPRLKYMLQPNMIRRLKKDVLDLPDKLYYTEYVENTPTQTKLYNKVTGELKQDRERIVHSLNPLAQFIKLRQVSGSPELVDNSIKVDPSYIKKNAKLQRLLQLLEEIHSRGEKVLIFSNWVEPLKTLYRFISVKYKTCCFTGTMSEKDRQHHKHVFMTNPEYTVMMGTIAAMGTTHTLTAATNVIFYDEPWTPSDKVQAEDRCVVKGTPIATPDGFIPIEQLKIGDSVFTHTGEVQRVTDCWNHTETADLVEIRFYGNPQPIVLTADHLVLTETGWRPAGQLRRAADDILHQDITARMCAADDTIRISSVATGFNAERDMYFINNYGVRQRNGRKHPIPEHIELTDDFLFFCGYYLGDGCAQNTYAGGQIQLAGNSSTKLQSLNRCRDWFRNTIQGAATLQTRDDNSVILYLSNILFNNFIASTFGRKHTEKHFPDWVFKLNEHQLQCLFDGLCASDGYLDTRGKGTTQQWYTTVTPALAAGVWWLMGRLGYRPRIELTVHDQCQDVYNIMCTINPTYRLKAGRIRSIKRYTVETTLYDITVSDDNSFYAWGTPLHNCHRIGTDAPSVNIYTLISKGTVDERVHNILYTKQGISNFIVDNVDIRKDPELFDLLLGDTSQLTRRTHI